MYKLVQRYKDTSLGGEATIAVVIKLMILFLVITSSQLMLISCTFFPHNQADSSVRVAGDANMLPRHHTKAPSVQTIRSVQPRILGRFEFEDELTVRFLLLDDPQPSVAVLESGRSGSRSIADVPELINASPSTLWHALDVQNREFPEELLESYGPPSDDRGAGWLIRRWLSQPPSVSSSGWCPNNWFSTKVGTEAAFPDADEHFFRHDLWQLGTSPPYYQYAYWVELWHGGVCLQDEIKLNELSPSGTGWTIWYLPQGGSSFQIIDIDGNPNTANPVVTEGTWYHFHWYKCGSCPEAYFYQEIYTNPGLLVQFDMGMDWTF